jgi:arabinose-5-phosphate isomerase
MAKVLSLMTAAEVRGVAGVLDEKDQLCGCVTDGDVRRRLEKNKNPLTEKAEDLMSRTPKTIDVSEMAEKALFIMEQFQIQNLFVVDKASVTAQKPVGLIHLQDLLRAKLR